MFMILLIYRVYSFNLAMVIQKILDLKQLKKNHHSDESNFSINDFQILLEFVRYFFDLQIKMRSKVHIQTINQELYQLISQNQKF